jgi:hypothetical protein
LILLWVLEMNIYESNILICCTVLRKNYSSE